MIFKCKHPLPFCLLPEGEGTHAGYLYKRVIKGGFGISGAKMGYGSALQPADDSLFFHCKLCAYFSGALFPSSSLHGICQSYEKVFQKF